MARSIAISGLLLVVFLVAHLLGLSLALLDPSGFERYATQLHRLAWLPLAEAVLALAALAHLALTLRRAMANARARGPAGYALWRSRRVDSLAALASRSAPWSGALLLLFLVVHLGQLRLPRPPDGLEAETLRHALASPWSLALYAAAGVAVGLHLLHGGESAHRSLGLLDGANGGRIRRAAGLLAALIGGGFALLPLAVAAGALWPPGLGAG